MSVSPTSFRALLADCTAALKSFQSSSSQFALFRTIQPPNQPRPPPPSSPLALVILDSSFNPPHLAHFHLATTALHAAADPHKRLLLLFSIHNADKRPSTSDFAARLAMMTLLATDMSLQPPSIISPTDPVPIDIALTTRPYYADKSAAIDASHLYPPGTTHRHVLGFDTYVRLLDHKYYPGFDPPLGALAGYFSAGHGLMVALRTEDDGGDEGRAQRGEVGRLGRGELEGEGGERNWGESVQVLELPDGAKGVSSTEVRRAVEAGEWSLVDKLCTERVTAFIREKGCYAKPKSAE